MMLLYKNYSYEDRCTSLIYFGLSSADDITTPYLLIRVGNEGP